LLGWDESLGADGASSEINRYTILLKNSFYNSLGGVIRIGLGVVTIPILIRTLGIAEYGVWTLASSVIAIVMLAESGLSFSTTFFLSKSLAKEDVEECSEVLTVTFSTITVAATLISVLLFLGTSPILATFPKLTIPQLAIAESALRLGTIVVWSRLIQQVLIGVEQAYQTYKSINLLGSIQAILTNGGMIIIAYNSGHSVELMQWQAIIGILSLIAHIWFVKSLLGSRFHVAWNYSKFLPILIYSFSTWMSSLGGVLFGQVDRLIVGAMLGVETLGIYSAITNITMQINSLSAMPIQPIVPILSRNTNEPDELKANIRSIVKKSFEINCIISLGLGVIFLTFDFSILSFLLDGKMALNHLNEFRFATIIYAIYSMNAVGYYIAFGKNYVTMCMLVQMLSGAVSLLLVYGGAKYFGLTGAILGNSGYCLVWLLTFVGFRKLNIKELEWMSWIVFPVLSFIVFSASVFLIQSNISLKWLMCFSCFLSLIVWFYFCNPQLFRTRIAGSAS
jgi:O-antigen/teichoic acid export membrane protein